MSENKAVDDALEHVLVPRSSLQSAFADGELIVFDSTSRVFHRLNPTATAVWVELDGVADLGVVAGRLAERYGVDLSVIRADMGALANEFDEQRLLESSGVPEAPLPPWVPALEPSTSSLRARHAAEVERRDWVVRGGPYQAFGFTFALVCDDDLLGHHLSDVLAPLARDDAGQWNGDEASEIRTYILRRPRPDPAPTDESPGIEATEAPDAVNHDADGPGGAEAASSNTDSEQEPADEPPEPSVPEVSTDPVRSTSGRWRLLLDGRHVQSNQRPSGLADHLLWHVNRMATETDSTHTIFHAAGASWDGAGILMPGQQNAGKSTLVTGLVAAGLGYLGDEAIALDSSSAWMLPFHKSIGLDQGSWTVFPKFEPTGAPAELQPTRWHVPPDRVRPGSRAGSVPVRYIVCPQFRSDADTSLEPMSDIDTVALLLEQAFHLADRPDALDQLIDVVEHAECYRLTVSSLADSVRLVCDVVGAPTP